jgi:hypothetical protein
MRIRYFAALMVALLLASPIAAQEQRGAIEGTVKDSSGGVLPGVTVEAKSQGGVVIAVVSDETGAFRFPSLPPDNYSVVATLEGFAPQTLADVRISLGQVKRVEFTLALAGIAETISVTAQATAVDVTNSSAATSISRERLDLIPRGRDFTDVVVQAAGAADESQAGGIAIDGSSGSENRFVIDGIDTTSPQLGTNAVPMRAEFMEEVQVKSAGYAAEFGGSTGGVINAITRSGSNAFHGNVLADFQQRAWGGSERPLLRDSLETDTFVYLNPDKDDETRIDPGFSLGGPIMRDRLWFFGSYQPGLRSTDRTVNFTNGDVNTFNRDFKVHYGAFNVTGNAGSKVLFRVGGNFSPYEDNGVLPGQDGRTSLTATENYARGTKGQRQTFSGSMDYIPTSRIAISGRAGRFTTDLQSIGVQFPELIHNVSTLSTPAGVAAIPAAFRRQAGFSSDVLVGDATTKDKYIRDYVGADATFYFSGLGEHQLKGGVQIENIYNDVQSGYNADRIIYYAGRSYTNSNGEAVRGTYGYFRLLNISTLGEVSSRNDAMFIQDTWKIMPKLTLNLGLRTEHERVPNFSDVGASSPIDFGFGDKLAPRLGFAYDWNGDGRLKIYGSFGKYYDVMKYELPRGSFGGAKWVDFYYTWDSPDWTSNTCHTGSNTIAERPACPAGTFIEPFDQRFNSANPETLRIDPDLKPMQENEYQLGITKELNWQGMVVGARFIQQDLIRTIEDVGVLVPGHGTEYYIANPGEGLSLSLADPGVPRFPKAERQYRGLELTFDRRFANNWAAFGSYTLSRLYGNYSGLASSDEDGRTAPNVNRFFDSIENSFDMNGNPVYGRLGTDRPHQFKGQFLYQFGWNMTVGIDQRVSSGIPISEEAFVAGGVPFFPFGRGNLARTDVVSQTNLKLTQNVKFGGYNIQLGVTVQNLFDQDAVTRRYNERTVSDLPLNTDEFFAGGWNYSSLLNPEINDVKFNQANQWQAPREVRFTVKFDF